MDKNNLTLKLKQRILTDFTNKKSSDWKKPDNEFKDFCTHLETGITNEFIVNKDIIGIARKIIKNGPGGYQIRNGIFFQKNFHDNYYIKKCNNCPEEISWSEMESAIEEGDYYCVDCRIENMRRQ
ncbi:hypothetical protein [Bacillus mycoides]|uniref:hypothetical protein n=1 Tax=Bacillus mycoides TaxID=1405 RepID=UPI001F093D9E|nr:hypothetical protein [Bacillus mycoides]